MHNYIYKTLLLITVFCVGIIGVSNAQQTVSLIGTGNVVVPCGVTEITVQAWGGGGGGGSGSSNNAGGGAGGGAGGYVTTTVTVAPGDVIAYTVGTGGVFAGGQGTSGGNTTFLSVTANGGTGGGNNGGAVGAGGGGTGGTVTNGGNGTANTGTTGGNGGSNPDGGVGGNGSPSPTNGEPGQAPGGGGGGGGERASGINGLGGAGGAGQLLLTYTVDASATCSELTTTLDAEYDDCSVMWYDSGNSGSNYGNNESYTVTFCPDTPGQAIRVDFASFDTEGGGGVCNDPLQLWMAANNTGTPDDTYCDNLGAFTVVSSSDDGCVTFQFESDGTTTRAGWEATVSCVAGCENPIASLAASFENICSPSSDIPGSLTVNFNASSSFAETGWNLEDYYWDFGDGTETVTTTATTSHTYADEGVYVAKLVVRDDNTSLNPAGCGSTNASTKTVRVIPEPGFSASTASASVFCDDCIDLTAQPVSQTYVQPIPTVETSPVFLPDGTNNAYTSEQDYSGLFPDGATVTTSCIPEICFNLEHSYSGDLDIELISPNGTSVLLYGEDEAGNNTYKFGDCVSSGTGTGGAGCPRNYCISNDDTGTDWSAAGVGETTPNANASGVDGCVIDAGWTGACETGTYYIGQVYNASGNLSDFIGDDLNGVWTIKITDQLASDDGYLFDWSLTFDPSCYRDLEFVTPDLSDVQWQTHTGTGPSTPGTQTVNSTVVSDPGPDPCPGSAICEGTLLENTIQLCGFPKENLANNSDVQTYNYDYKTTDEFSCEYTRTVTVDHSCATLPIDLIYFEGMHDKRKNILSWATETESNNDYFVIEYSSNGEEWKEIEVIDGAGTSTSMLTYSTIHFGFKRDNINYYRLTQVDYDGQQEVFKSISIDNRESVKVVKTVNLLGQEVGGDYKGVVMDIYDDGSTKKRIQN